MSSRYSRWGKRLVDVVGAIAACAVLAPAAGVVAVVLLWRLGSPVLFVQERAGQHGRPFRVLKFRTMTRGEPPAGDPRGDGDRMSPLGRFLRGSSLDEIPQLWNVLRGEMSLVGPRPLYVTYVERYTVEQRRRLEVKPGITGWGQINGRNALTWEEKHALDVWYVDNVSLWLDVKILLRTPGAVMRRRGISHADHPTMPEFVGDIADTQLSGTKAHANNKQQDESEASA